MKPSLSIITITYRDPSGLRATLESLKPLLSSEIRWEHIVIDSSKEDNQAAIDELPSDWPLIRISTPPRGIFSAMNEGFQKASGDILWYLNGGDELLSLDALSSATKRMDGRGLDLMCMGVEVRVNSQLSYPRFPKSTFKRSLLGAYAIHHQGVLIRRTFQDKVGKYDSDLKIAGDFDFFYRCYLERPTAHCTQEPLAFVAAYGVSDQRWFLAWKERLGALCRLTPKASIAFSIQSLALFFLDLPRYWVFSWVKRRLAKPGLIRGWSRIRVRSTKV